jgi:phosphoesterase RecJ-like protein
MSNAVALPQRSAVDLKGAADLLRRFDRILVVSHQRPDGDCLGSTIGLLRVLRALGKKVAAYNATPLTAKWDFLEGIGDVHNALPDWQPEMTVFVDCGSVVRVHDQFVPVGTVLNIDHHLTNECFGDFNWIDVPACAVGEQVHDLAVELGVPIDKPIAAALFLSILTDTGGFRFSNTSARALRIAGELVAAGAEPGTTSQAVYENRSRGEITLSGIAMQSIRYEFGGRLAWSELRWSDYEQVGGQEAEPEGLVSEIRSVEGVEVSCLLHETKEGNLRAGFRGKGRVDCSAIAVQCGGGGHFNASGANLKTLGYEEAKAKVLSVLRAELAKVMSGEGKFFKETARQ